MIKGFEDITHELTDREIEAMIIIAQHLKPHIGKDKAITNRAICKGMATVGFKLTEPRVRKMIHEIRIRGMVKCLISTSKGYYVAPDPKELRDYVKSLGQRLRSIKAVEQAMADQLSEYYTPTLFKK